MEDDKLYINGLEIDNFKLIDDDLSPENLCIDLPNHTVIELVNCDKWIGTIDESDAEKFFEVTRLDTDKYIGKKIRLLIQVIGNSKESR